MQKQITIEQLAGYLPYLLPVKILNHNKDGVGIEYSVVTGYYYLGSHLHVTYFGGSTGKSISEFMPCLRPLSSVTKEITHNGETFIPAEEIFKNSNYENKIGIPSEIEQAESFLGPPCSIDNAPYWIVKELLSMHFDIHGLIDAGLALPIND